MLFFSWNSTASLCITELWIHLQKKKKCDLTSCVWQHTVVFPVALNELLAGHHGRLHFDSVKADFVFSFHIISLLCWTEWRATQGKHPTAKQACLVDMFVIQLMHYLEAAGCGTSIQLAQSATVHRSPNYFWWFSSFNYCWTADCMDTTAVKRCRRPTSVGLNVKWAEITHAQVCVIALFTIDFFFKKGFIIEMRRFWCFQAFIQLS